MAMLTLERGLLMQRPSSPLLNSIFISTAKRAARTLLAVATASGEDKWSPLDHIRYMAMLTTWFSLWVLRLIMDHFPFSLVPSLPAILGGFSSSDVGIPPLSPSSSLQLVLHEGYKRGFDGSSSISIDRALSHIFSLLNEIPVTSRKYQFVIALADKIVDENTFSGSETLRDINRRALSAAFARTAALLHRALHAAHYNIDCEDSTWLSRAIHALPLGSHLLSYARTLSFCVGALFPSTQRPDASRMQVVVGFMDGGGTGARRESVMAEKLAQELFWTANKMRGCGAADEAVVQWSFESGLASLALTSNARVQATIVKISALLIREAVWGDFEASRQVKFQLLLLWLPLLCYANNGVAYPVLTGSEMVEMEGVMDELISTLPVKDQEVVLANWLQDFTFSSSDWPNLQRSYDRWCRSSRKLLI